MINSKQRAFLRGKANSYETILQIGKGGISENLRIQVDDALEARELIKIRCLENSVIDSKSAAAELSSMCNADVVQVIGSKIILYRPSKEPVIVLP